MGGSYWTLPPRETSLSVKKKLAYASGGQLWIADLTSNAKNVVGPLNAPLSSLYFVENGSGIVSESSAGTVHHWNSSNDVWQDTLVYSKRSKGRLPSFVLLPAGQHSVAAFEFRPQRVRFLNLVTNREEGVIRNVSQSASLKFNDEGSRLVVSNPDGLVQLLEVPSGGEIWRGHSGTVAGALITPSGRQVLVTPTLRLLRTIEVFGIDAQATQQSTLTMTPAMTPIGSGALLPTKVGWLCPI
jgi:WD40 repeat protein